MSLVAYMLHEVVPEAIRLTDWQALVILSSTRDERKQSSNADYVFNKIQTSTKSMGLAEAPSMLAETMLLGAQTPVVGVTAGVGVDPSNQAPFTLSVMARKLLMTQCRFASKQLCIASPSTTLIQSSKPRSSSQSASSSTSGLT